MGILWRLLAPKPLKRARRTVRKATHPVHTVTRAVTPKPVKKLQRAAHPLSLAELKAEDAVVNALSGKRSRRRPRKSTTARRPAARRQAARAPQKPAGQPQAQPWTPQAASPETDHRPGSKWQAPLAERYARRQAEAPARAADYQARDAARRQRRAAVKQARGPWRWPEWTLIASATALVASFVLAGVAGSSTDSGAGLAAGSLGLIGLFAAIVGVPAVLWRWYRARRAAAAMLASAGESQADHHPN